LQWQGDSKSIVALTLGVAVIDHELPNEFAVPGYVMTISEKSTNAWPFMIMIKIRGQS